MLHRRTSNIAFKEMTSQNFKLKSRCWREKYKQTDDVCSRVEADTYATPTRYKALLVLPYLYLKCVCDQAEAEGTRTLHVHCTFQSAGLKS